MIDKGLAKVLAVLGLFTMGFLFLLRDSLAESLPAELRELLRGSGDDRRNFGAARPNDHVGARKPHAKTKMLALAKGALDSPQVPLLEINVPVPPFPSKSEVRLGMSRSEFLARFGDPDASATWCELGTLHEKFVYLYQEKYADVLIKSGSVVSNE